MKDKNWPGNPLPLPCLLWTVAHWRPLLVRKVTSSYWVCVLGGGEGTAGGGQKRPRRRRWRRNRTAMKHQTVSSSGAAERDLWPQAVQSIKHLLFILQCSRKGRGRILEEEGLRLRGGGARGALTIIGNVFGESFWERQKKTKNMPIVCRLKFIVSFSINEKYAHSFLLVFFVLKCIS